MDLVFSRYTNPFFLNTCIENSYLTNFIDMLMNKQNEEKTWEMYLATLPYNKKTFNEWKKEIFSQNVKFKETRMSKKEIDATIKKSKEILRAFKPQQRRDKIC